MRDSALGDSGVCVEGPTSMSRSMRLPSSVSSRRVAPAGGRTPRGAGCLRGPMGAGAVATSDGGGNAGVNLGAGLSEGGKLLRVLRLLRVRSR